MIETYKIITKKYDLDPETLFVFNRDHTRGHKYKLYKRSFSHDVRKYFFTYRVISQWNNLSNHIVSAETVNEFKNRLDKFWSYGGLMYDEELPPIL